MEHLLSSWRKTHDCQVHEWVVVVEESGIVEFPFWFLTLSSPVTASGRSQPILTVPNAPSAHLRARLALDQPVRRIDKSLNSRGQVWGVESSSGKGREEASPEAFVLVVLLGVVRVEAVQVNAQVCGHGDGLRKLYGIRHGDGAGWRIERGCLYLVNSADALRYSTECFGPAAGRSSGNSDNKADADDGGCGAQ